MTRQDMWKQDMANRAKDTGKGNKTQRKTRQYMGVGGKYRPICGWERQGENGTSMTRQAKETGNDKA